MGFRAEETTTGMSRMCGDSVITWRLGAGGCLVTTSGAEPLAHVSLVLNPKPDDEPLGSVELVHRA